MSEVEAEGEILMKFLAAFGGALGALANEPVASAAPPEVGDALDKAERGFGHGGAYAIRRALAARDLDDRHVAQMEKIISEVMNDYQKVGTKVSDWWCTWLLDRRVELARGDRADREPEVEKEPDDAAD